MDIGFIDLRKLVHHVKECKKILRAIYGHKFSLLFVLCCIVEIAYRDICLAAKPMHEEIEVEIEDEETREKVLN